MNVPHTDDVKETFGSMIDTVVEQEAEIKVINNNLETVVEDTGETYEEMRMVVIMMMRLRMLMRKRMMIVMMMVVMMLMMMMMRRRRRRMMIW